MPGVFLQIQAQTKKPSHGCSGQEAEGRGEPEVLRDSSKTILPRAVFFNH